MHIPKRNPNKVVSKHGLLFLLHEDYEGDRCDSTRPGFRAIASYRFAVWARGLRNSGLRRPFSSIGGVMLRFVRNIMASTSCDEYHRPPVSDRAPERHCHSQVCDHRGRLSGASRGNAGHGRDCALIARNLRNTAPVLGDRVDVGVGAVIVGNIRIGDDVNIGPNAVVLTDVPAGATVMAPLAKMIRPAPETAAVSNVSPVTNV